MPRTCEICHDKPADLYDQKKGRYCCLTCYSLTWEDIRKLRKPKREEKPTPNPERSEFELEVSG